MEAVLQNQVKGKPPFFRKLGPSHIHKIEDDEVEGIVEAIQNLQKQVKGKPPHIRKLGPSYIHKITALFEAVEEDPANMMGMQEQAKFIKEP